MPNAFDETSELSWLSLAYLDSGVFLARAIVDEDLPPSIHRIRVPLFLIHQALELLFKSALLATRGHYPKSHDINALYADFSRDLPDLAFPIPACVLGADTRTLELFPSDPAARPMQHERLRYATDRKGRAWPEIDQGVLAAAIDELEQLNKPVLRTWLRIRQLSGH